MMYEPVPSSKKSIVKLEVENVDTSVLSMSFKVPLIS